MKELTNRVREMNQTFFVRGVSVLGGGKVCVLNDRFEVRLFRTYTCGDEDCLVNE